DLLAVGIDDLDPSLHLDVVALLGDLAILLETRVLGSQARIPDPAVLSGGEVVEVLDRAQVIVLDAPYPAEGAPGAYGPHGRVEALGEGAVQQREGLAVGRQPIDERLGAGTGERLRLAFVGREQLVGVARRRFAEAERGGKALADVGAQTL